MALLFPFRGGHGRRGRHHFRIHHPGQLLQPGDGLVQEVRAGGIFFINLIVDVADGLDRLFQPRGDELGGVLGNGQVRRILLQPGAGGNGGAPAVRKFRVKRDDTTNMWTIDDGTWQDVIASGYKKVAAEVDLDAVEVWEIENRSGGWFHPVHIHLVDFKVLSRNGRAPFPQELGPKDVVYVGEGETVRLLMKFGPHRGRYMVHCHNLPHEDHDMMVQFRVGLKEDDNDPNDPMTAALPQWDG
jgi:FtsP/CotA-like multicopper oxidase with cupredoxin domain